jgi:hypothetical protein
MSLKNRSIRLTTTAGGCACEPLDAPAGEYVPLALVQDLEQTLSKLVWTVLYGKSFDAQQLAVSAEAMLGKLRQAA